MSDADTSEQTSSRKKKRAYRSSERKPKVDKLERRRLRLQVREQLQKGVHPDDAVEQLVRDGYEREWADRLVERVDDAIQDELNREKSKRRSPAADAGGSAGAGLIAGLFAGIIGIVLVYALSKAPATRRGALIGFAIRVGFTILIVLLSLPAR